MIVGSGRTLGRSCRSAEPLIEAETIDETALTVEAMRSVVHALLPCGHACARRPHLGGAHDPGREASPAGRPDFKPGEGRPTFLVGSTPTPFRHG